MWIVYLKEMRELLRDRKTLIFTILIPIFVMPMLIVGFSFLTSTLHSKAEQAELRYAIFGQQNSPLLSERFAHDKSFREVKLDDPNAIKTAIADERIKFALVIPPYFDQAASASAQAVVALHYNSAASGDVTLKRVNAVIEAHNGTLRTQALAALGLSQSQLAFALNPVRVEEHSTANLRERIGAIIGGMLPYILLIVCLTSALYPAADLGAGEKERGTLETLLLAPIPRTHLVVAKFLVLFSFGLTPALLMVTSLGVLLHLFGANFNPELAAIAAAIGVGDLAMVALMLVPTAAIFASALLSISIYAKSYKEAMGMMQPTMILTILPIVLAMVPGVDLTWMWAMVPLTNVSLAMKEIVKGTMDYRMFFVIFLSTTVIAGVLLSLCRWWFNREQVLFRN